VVKIGAPGFGATLSEHYLRRTTPDGAQALEHAYAITTYAAQGKTFDKVMVMLDPGVNREDFLVAVSRARGETTAYIVAARELVDDDFGPGTREISDRLHDVRAGSERVASEYAGVEVEPRGALEEMSATGLARYRQLLIKDLEEAGRPDIADDRRVALDRRIESARARLDSLAAERSQAEDPDSAARLEGLQRQGERQLSRLEQDRAGLPPAAKRVDPAKIDGWRYDLNLVEEWMTQLRRKAVEAERSEPTAPIVSRLGTRPEELEKVKVWDEGADLIYGFRLRWGITDEEGDALGVALNDASYRADRRSIEMQLAPVCEALEVRPTEPEQTLDLAR
jgi:hypothetical protein